MAHAAYLFLMDLASKGLSDEACRAMAAERLETGFHKQLDSNNWHHPIGLLLDDRPMILCNEEDTRTAHELLEEQERSRDIFKDTIDQSWRYDAADYIVQNKHIDWSTLPIQNQRKAREGFIERVTIYAAALEADPSIGIIPNDGEFQEFALNKLRQIASAARNCRIGGFTLAKRATPYVWRCFDLRTSTKAEPNAILFMDIHT